MRLRMSRAIPPVHLYTFMALTEKHLFYSEGKRLFGLFGCKVFRVYNAYGISGGHERLMLCTL